MNQVIKESVYEFLRNYELCRRIENKRNKIALLKSGSRVLAYLALYPLKTNIGMEIRLLLKMPDYSTVNLVYRTGMELEIGK